MSATMGAAARVSSVSQDQREGLGQSHQLGEEPLGSAASPGVGLQPTGPKMGLRRG